MEARRHATHAAPQDVSVLAVAIPLGESSMSSAIDEGSQGPLAQHFLNFKWVRFSPGHQPSEAERGGQEELLILSLSQLQLLIPLAHWWMVVSGAALDLTRMMVTAL